MPLVSVIVLYYKRRATIAETIESVLQQDYPLREVILVDNHSEDGLKEWIGAQDYDVNVVELPENLGACAGRNAGIAVARGQILILLDDDMSFMSVDELTKVVERFEQQSNVHTLAFRVCDPDSGELRLREWCHPRYWKEAAEIEFETHWFCEGASAFRREVFDSCGGYYEPLFYGAEGHDLSIRIVDHGFRIIYTPDIRVGHRAAAEGRSSHRQYYYFTRNYVWMAFKDYRAWDGMVFLVRNLLMMGYFALRTANYGPFVQGVWDGFSGLRQIRRDRTPASKETVKYWAELDRYRPGFMVRLKRHRTAPQV
jgi:GT2 family glycosyltransferase